MFNYYSWSHHFYSTHQSIIIRHAVFDPRSFVDSPVLPIVSEPISAVSGIVVDFDKPVSISFAARVGNGSSTPGVLFLVSDIVDTKFLTVMLEANGQLSLQYSYGAGPVQVSTKNFGINDGKWHDIRVARSVSTATITVDGGDLTFVGTAAQTVPDAWKPMFSNGTSGVLAGAQIGGQLFNLNVDGCALRCIDEPACLSFDFQAAMNVNTAPDVNSTSGGNSPSSSSSSTSTTTTTTTAATPTSSNSTGNANSTLLNSVCTLHSAAAASSASLITAPLAMHYDLLSAGLNDKTLMIGHAHGIDVFPGCLGSVSLNGNMLNFATVANCQGCNRLASC